MSRRSAPGSLSSTLHACSTSSRPSGYFFSMRALSCASRRSASCTLSGSPEMRKTLPRCPMWTPRRFSTSLRFSLRPPARALAPSLSISSRRAEGSAISLSLIERWEQDKPVWGPPVMIALAERVAQVLLGYHSPVDQLAQLPRILPVLEAVQLQCALQAEQLAARDEPRHRATPGRVFRPGGSQGRRHQVDQEQGRGEEEGRQRQPEQRPAPRQPAAALRQPFHGCPGAPFGRQDL